jgi:hypothetical protein
MDAEVVVVVLGTLREVAWGKGPAEVDMPSSAAVGNKVWDNLALDVNLFKGNQVGQLPVLITLIPEMTIGGARGTIATIIITITGLVLGTISNDGLVRTMGEEEVPFSRDLEEMVRGCRLEVQLMRTYFIKLFKW